MGRKRKAGPRYPSGDLKPAIDRGTAESQSRRKFNAGDENLTWHVLGILRANDAITEDQYRAACEYRWLFAVVYRKPELIAAPLDGMPKGKLSDIDDQAILRAKKRMNDIQHKLELMGRAAKDALDNLVIYDRQPRWMRPVPPRVSDVRASSLFMDALRAIAGDSVKKAA